MTGTGNSFASFLLGQVQNFSIDVQREVLRPRAQIAEFFFQDDFKATRQADVEPRRPLHAEFSIHGGGRSRRRLQSANPEARLSRARTGIPRAARNLEKLNFAPRVGLAFRLTDSFIVRSGYGMTWIEQAGITTPFTTPLFPFIQTAGPAIAGQHQSGVRALARPVRAGHGAESGQRPGAGRVRGGEEQKSGYAQQWNLSFQKTFGEHWSMEVGYLGSKLTNLGVPDVNLNQLTAEQLALGSSVDPAGAESVFRSDSGIVVARRPDDRAAAAAAAVSRALRRSRFYRNNVGHSTYHSFQTRLERRFSGGLTFTRRLHIFKADRRRRRRVRCRDSYRSGRIVPGGGQLQSAPGEGRIHRQHSARVFRIVCLGASCRTGPALGPERLAERAGRRLAAGRHRSSAIRKPARGDAGDQSQRVRRIRNSAAESHRQIRRFPPKSAARLDGSTPRRLPRRRSSRSATARAIRSSGPGYQTLDVMLGKTFPITEQVRAEFRAEAFNVTNTPPLAAPNTSFGNAAFGTITRAFDPRVFELVLKLHF